MAGYGTPGAYIMWHAPSADCSGRAGCSCPLAPTASPLNPDPLVLASRGRDWTAPLFAASAFLALVLALIRMLGS